MLSQSPRHKACLELIPETRFVVFSGDEHNAEVVKLRGVLRLTAPEAMSIKAVKVRFEGKRRVGWFYSGGVSAGEVVDKKVFHNEVKPLGAQGTHKVKAGVTEWPFEFELAADMPESVEGYPNTWLVYNLYADVERPMWNQKDLHASKHIRLVRTLGADQMEMTRSRTNADIWANKISYSISIPSDAVVFGTSIMADVELAPLKKGITLGKVELRLIENIIRRIAPSDASEYRQDRVKMDEFEVAKEEMPFPEDSKVTFEDETVDNPRLEDERYHFKARLHLPKSLKKCRQDVDSHAIHISHKFKLMVNIHNPEGHVSQLVCRLPVKLFISPNLPIDDENQVQSGTTEQAEDQLNNQESTVTAPPVYGQHQLDEIYSDIQPSGFHTTAPSGIATPNILSRRGSNENLATTNTPDSQRGQINSALLRSRLASLQEDAIPGLQHPSSSHSSSYHSSGNISPRPAYGRMPSYSHRTASNTTTPHSNSGQHSRRGSSDSPPPPDDDHPVLQGAYDMDDLTRIPSYGTALRTPNATTPFSEGPPSYMEATSRPPSPGSLSPARASPTYGSVPRNLTSARGGGDYLNSHSIDSAVTNGRSSVDTTPRIGTDTVLRTGFSSPQSEGSVTTIGAPAPAHVRRGTDVEHGDAMVRMLRGRG
ncbi:hypothetical protein K461DRAFT_15701 [Myriangium duriaei CBS 260.36]|uniref:Arrestin C-terminal-like domain-containing protein n=1 Tax=Myriangium duriaei CBS 260.36 TaxID=1168546 RepID=A0A9P4MSB5_9PEZI|nr:hypothetical protein K461DRAFT_15701 [Myriangium duriaei CBS 260.36]